MTLVQVPYQPECWLTPDTLALLQRVNARLGTQLRINGSDGAWRAYADQKRYYDAYMAYLRGGPWAAIAGNPDTGQRNHMRGAAFDLVRTDAAVQAACRAEGLIRDYDESWHWNNPNAANMPIIMTNTSTAGGGANAIPIPLEDDLPDMNTFLNTPAFDNGPTISEMFKQLNAVWQGLYGTGNPAVPGNGSIVGLIDGIPARVWATPVSRAGVPVSALQELADAKTVALRIEAAQKKS